MTDLFCPGDRAENAVYECYKIPTLLRIPNASLLLGFVEARRFSCSDAGWIDLMVKASHDNGQSWSEPQLVVSDSAVRSSSKEWHTIGDALPVYDEHTRRIQLVFTRDNEDAFVTQSDNLGASWSRPTNISSVAIPKRGAFCGTGHAAGLQLRGSGRLLVPMYCQGNAVTQKGGGAFALLSDDHGATWWRGSALPGADGNEWVAAPVGRPGSGQLIGSLRSTTSRLQAFSSDGGQSWSAPEHTPSLPEPISGCEGAMIRHPNGRLYYSHPEGHLLRQLMSIKVSDDDGKTWAHHTQIWGPQSGCPAPCVPAASYSSLAVLGESKSSRIGILFMRNNVTMLIFEGRGVTFATFAP